MSEVTVTTRERAWEDLNPLTRSVVAGFSSRIGWEEGELNPNKFMDDYVAAFESSREHIAKGMGYFGEEGIRNGIINNLQGFEPDRVSELCTEIGDLAGSAESEGVRKLAAQVGVELIGTRRYDVIPALQLLSELAASRLASQTPPEEPGTEAPITA